MTADQAIEAAKAAFGERDVSITADRGILRIASKTHHYECALAHDVADVPDVALTDDMLPVAVETLTRAIVSGKAPPRQTA